MFTNTKNDKDFEQEARIIMSNVNRCYKNIITKSLFSKSFSFLLSNYVINKQMYDFNSSSCTIIRNPESEENFILCVRSCNYYLNKNATSVNPYSKTITVNSLLYLDKLFNLTNTKTLETSYSNNSYIGIEDVRLFVFQKEIYFMGSMYNPLSKKIQIASNTYDVSNNKFDPIFLTPSFKTTNHWEKNWVFFNNQGKLGVIYKWFPVYICGINYKKKNLILIKKNEKVPSFFSRLRGSTSGVDYDDKIWFISHIYKVVNERRIYLHLFVCFDKSMNLLSYSDPFNFENNVVEFCIGLVINNNNFVITYSTLDCSTKMCVLSGKFVESLMIPYILVN